jgi:hypothetical protein
LRNFFRAAGSVESFEATGASSAFESSSNSDEIMIQPRWDGLIELKIEK